MTRLQTADFSNIPGTLREFDLRLRLQTGSGLKGVAARAAGLTGDVSGIPGPGVRVAVIPMTCGEGVLNGFSEAVAAIAGHLGADSFVVRGTDVAGLAEAFESGAEIVMLADEERFVAINLATRRVSDNSEMTGRAFATALDLMAAGLRARKALLLGCGAVGRAAATALTGYGALVTVFDPDTGRSRKLASDLEEARGVSVLVAPDLRTALSSHECILDATPAGGFITGESIGARTILCFPRRALRSDRGGCGPVGGEVALRPASLGSCDHVDGRAAQGGLAEMSSGGDGKPPAGSFYRKRIELFRLIDKIKLWPSRKGILHGIRSVEMVSGQARITTHCNKTFMVRNSRNSRAARQLRNKMYVKACATCAIPDWKLKKYSATRFRRRFGSFLTTTNTES